MGRNLICNAAGQGIKEIMWILGPPTPWCMAVPLCSWWAGIEPSDILFDQCWCAHPELYFTCHLRPAGRRQPKKSNCMYGNNDILAEFIWCSIAPSSTWSCKAPKAAAAAAQWQVELQGPQGCSCCPVSLSGAGMKPEWEHHIPVISLVILQCLEISQIYQIRHFLSRDIHHIPGRYFSTEDILPQVTSSKDRYRNHNRINIPGHI